jgi:cell division protein DivIC
MEPLRALLAGFWQRLAKASLTKYVVVLLIAGVWMVLFDRYNLLSQLRMSQQIERLKKDEAHYRHAIQSVGYEENKVFSDREELERFAREKYFMRRPGEDVFVITEAPQAPEKE